MTIEHRFAPARVTGRQLEGIAAPFGSVADMGTFKEIIAPGAFAASLRSNPDILALADHNTARVLGRTRSGTLTLRETAAGLEYSLTLPDTSAGNDLRALAERGDLGGISMGFECVRDSWAGEVRTLHEVRLIEISVVQAFPAYTDTTVALRSRPADGLAVQRAWLDTVRA